MYIYIYIYIIYYIRTRSAAPLELDLLLEPVPVEPARPCPSETSDATLLTDLSREADQEATELRGWLDQVATGNFRDDVSLASFPSSPARSNGHHPHTGHIWGMAEPGSPLNHASSVAKDSYY